MEINKLTDIKLQETINDYIDKIDSLKSAIDYHKDDFTKRNIRNNLNEYISYLDKLKAEKKKRSFVNNVAIDEENALSIIDNILIELETKAIFIKNSYPGKMHFEALSSQHSTEIGYCPTVVYQIYLAFSMSGKLINRDNKKIYSIEKVSSIFQTRIGKPTFIQRVDANKGRNAFDRNSNPNTADYLNLANIDLWQGIMFYFFL